jgi:cystathionine gamma-synthase
VSHPDLRPESIVVAAGRPAREPDAPMNTPIVLSAPFHAADDNHYSRWSATETVRAFEAAVGALEGGEAIAFASGLSAAAAVIEGQRPGAVAVTPRSAYSGTIQVFDEQLRLGRMSRREVDIADSDAVTAALGGADLVWLESVTNPLLEVPDLPVVLAAARQAGVTSVVDSTFSTPLNVRPLDHGADLVMHSATKYISGHSDLIMGVLVTRSPERAEALRHRRGLTGGMPGALECYLALRGIRTLAVRMERAQANAAELARRLSAHPSVSRVRYPGLPDDRFHGRAATLFAGFGAVVCFELPDAASAEAVCERVELITHATSLGGVESLIERRARYDTDREHGAPEGLLRLSVGIEHVDDLWADLTRAMSAGQ